MDNLDPEKNPDVSRYDYYVAGLKIGGEDFTVRAVVATDKNGDRYYDHALTRIEKSALIDMINDRGAIPSASTEFAYNSRSGEAEPSIRRPEAGNQPSENSDVSPISDIKDKPLALILQEKPLKYNTEEAKKLGEREQWVPAVRFRRAVPYNPDDPTLVFDRTFEPRSFVIGI